MLFRSQQSHGHFSLCKRKNSVVHERRIRPARQAHASDSFVTGIVSADKLQLRIQEYTDSLADYQNNEYTFDVEYLERIEPNIGAIAARLGYSRPQK